MTVKSLKSPHAYTHSYSIVINLHQCKERENPELNTLEYNVVLCGRLR